MHLCYVVVQARAARHLSPHSTTTAASVSTDTGAAAPHHSVYDRAGDEGPRSLHNHGEGPYHVTGGDVTTMLALHLLLPLVVLVVVLAPVLVTISPEQVYQEVSLDQVCRAGAKVGNNLVIY